MKNFWAQLVEFEEISKVIIDLCAEFSVEFGESARQRTMRTDTVQNISYSRHDDIVVVTLLRCVEGSEDRYEATVCVPSYVLTNLEPDLDEIPRILAQMVPQERDTTTTTIWKQVLRKRLEKRLS